MIWIATVMLSLAFSKDSAARAIAIDEAWNPVISGPEIMGPHFIKEFNALPLVGEVAQTKKYWSGDYWALRKGNINNRWYSQNRIGFNLISPEQDEARSMTIPMLAELSPSEKYDLFTGSYDYPLKKAVSEIAYPEAQSWEGICHGWSPASMNHNEPTPKLMFNPDGIEIPFGSTDIKALLSYYYAHVHQVPDTHQMGRRCSTENRNDSDCLNDLNAGAFHIVLANKLGFNKEGLIADVQHFDEVWNHPITLYKSTIKRQYGRRRNSAREAVKVLLLQTTIEIVTKGKNDWHPVQPSKESLTYEYELELDSNGSIIGGEWKSKKRPDFLWAMDRPHKFVGILSRLGELLNDE